MTYTEAYWWLTPHCLVGGRTAQKCKHKIANQNAQVRQRNQNTHAQKHKSRKSEDPKTKSQIETSKHKIKTYK